MFANFTGIVGSIRTRQVQGQHGTTTVANVSIANNQGDNTLWFSKALWGKNAEAALRTLKKGDRVQVSGAFEEQPWSRNGKSGVNRVLSAESIVIKSTSANAPLFARIAVLEENQRRMMAILDRVAEVLDAPEDSDADADHDDFEDFEHAENEEEDVAF